ncbi:hypothetical protein EVAR_36150_1 [Eumeta japonica]|uniref:Uncharacterized protein n=1 Tax=Eumeta variegata TaxID=151549 RepID=A0A4C1X179_EUMVA|nr:hypothetical protein EVAR_36150_1 [Eumeta japonica]
MDLKFTTNRDSSVTRFLAFKLEIEAFSMPLRAWYACDETGGHSVNAKIILNEYVLLLASCEKRAAPHTNPDPYLAPSQKTTKHDPPQMSDKAQARPPRGVGFQINSMFIRSVAGSSDFIEILSLKLSLRSR